MLAITLERTGRLPSVRRPKRDSSRRVDIIELGFNVIEPTDKVLVRQSPPLPLNPVGECLAVSRRPSRIGTDDHIALLGKHGRIPPRTPPVVPRTLRPAMN
jgi:hypothetical protein